MMLSNDAMYTLGLGLAALLVVRMIASRIRRPNYPPGPPKKPFIGNLLDMPQEEAWVTYAKWKENYGDVVYLEIMGSPLVILNSYKACIDLLEKRSDIYSDRPGTIMSTKLMGWGNAVTLAPYGDRWRRYRRICAQSMRKEAVKQFHPIQEREVARYLDTLVKNPEDFMKNFRFIAGRSLLWNIYGVQVKGSDDPIITTAEKAMAVGVFAAQPGNFLVDFFPALLYVPKWFPGAAWKEYARKGSILVNEMVDVPFDITLKDMKNGDHEPSFTSLNLEKNEDTDIVKWTSGTMFSAGIDTSVASIHAFVLAMVLHPEVQRRAQAEIDSVCGKDRLPSIADRDDFPYVNALIKEVMRWQPVSPLALPHRLTKDDVYEGHVIPAGTVVMGNTWAVTRDPTLFEDPERFNPDRYLPSTGKELPLDPTSFAFGYGRRICAGLHYADTMLFVSIARVLATFDLTPALDDNGQQVIPEIKFNSMIVRESLDFKCSIQPRSEDSKKLIQANLS